MSRGLLRRVQQLEVRSAAATSQRVAIICCGEGESSSEAIARHGLVPGEQRLVILRRYGAATCWCLQGRQMQKTL